jgi:hypothetical protein
MALENLNYERKGIFGFTKGRAEFYMRSLFSFFEKPVSSPVIHRWP